MKTCCIVKEQRKIRSTTKRRKSNWIGHILHVNCLLKHVIEGKKKEWEDQEKDVSNYWRTLRKRVDAEPEGGSTKQHCLEDWLCKRP